MSEQIDDLIQDGLEQSFERGLKTGGLMLAGAIKHMIKTGTTMEGLDEFLSDFIERNELGDV